MPKAAVMAYTDAARYQGHASIAAVHRANVYRCRRQLVSVYGVPPDRLADGISEHSYPAVADALERHFAIPSSRTVVGADVEGWIDLPTTVSGYGHPFHWSRRP
jgi:hypothetical protein